MRKPRKLDVACPNKNCRTYNKVGLRNIVRNGKQSNGTQKYKCTECGRNLVRTINTPFFHKHLSKKEIISISKQFVEKSSFRGVARSTGHHLDTIRSLASDVAQHCEAVTEFLLHDVKLGTHEIDEFWNFVKKNKKKLPINFSQTLNRAMRTLT
jgi:transposase-like protein